MLTRTIKMAFWVFYDHLGKLLVANFLCACAVILPLSVAFSIMTNGDALRSVVVSLPLTVATCAVIAPISQAGLLWMAKELIEKRDGSLVTFFLGMRRFAVRAAALGCLYCFAVVCLVCSVWFYGVWLSAAVPVAGYGLSAVALWVFVFLTLTWWVVLPALINRNAGVGATLKMAFALTLDNPFFVAGVALHAGVVLVFSLAPPVLLFCSFAPLAVLQASAYEMLSRKYAAVEAYRESTGKSDRPAAIDFGDDNDEYLCRGFRDLLFPWKE